MVNWPTMELKDDGLDAKFIDLFIAFSMLHKESETKLFLSDLVTKRELRYLATRLRIAMLLGCGYTYREIVETMGVSSTTIATVRKWLDVKGDGYKLVMQNLGHLGQLPPPRDALPRGCNNDDTTRTGYSRSGKYEEVFWPVDIVAAICKGIAKPKKK